MVCIALSAELSTRVRGAYRKRCVTRLLWLLYLAVHPVLIATAARILHTIALLILLLLWKGWTCEYTFIVSIRLNRRPSLVTRGLMLPRALAKTADVAARKRACVLVLLVRIRYGLFVVSKRLVLAWVKRILVHLWRVMLIVLVIPVLTIARLKQELSATAAVAGALPMQGEPT